METVEFEGLPAGVTIQVNGVLVVGTGKDTKGEIKPFPNKWSVSLLKPTSTIKQKASSLTTFLIGASSAVFMIIGLTEGRFL